MTGSGWGVWMQNLGSFTMISIGKSWGNIYIYMEYIYIDRISRGFSWDIANFMRGSGDLSIKNSDLE
jgi:hypothetical protein